MDLTSGSVRSRLLIIVGAAALVAWVAFGALFVQMYGAQAPHGAGFDFELLLAGARRIAAGRSPYDPAMLTGTATGITELFYTYPPFVAQALVPIAGVPSIIPIAGFLVAAVAAAATALGWTAASEFGLPRLLAIPLALVALPFWFPLTLALLFANLDAAFVAADVVLLAALLRRSPSRGHVVVAGMALALTGIAKLQPASLGIWLIARGLRTWRTRRGPGRAVRHTREGVQAFPIEWRVAAVALATGVVLVATSAAVGGLAVWLDYITMLRTSTGTGLLDPRNLGPAAQLAMSLGLGPSAVGPVQAVIDLVAVGGTLAAAMLVDDPLTSFGAALVASLVVLPVTWFHHFAVLLVVLTAGIARVWHFGGLARRHALMAAGAAFGIGILGFGTMVAWLLLLPVLGATRIGLGADANQQALPPVPASH